MKPGSPEFNKRVELACRVDRMSRDQSNRQIIDLLSRMFIGYSVEELLRLARAAHLPEEVLQDIEQTLSGE